jgi:hypothetical protein
MFDARRQRHRSQLSGSGSAPSRARPQARRDPQRVTRPVLLASGRTSKAAAVTKPSEAAGKWATPPYSQFVAASPGRGLGRARGLGARWQERPPHRARRHPHRLLAVLCWLVGCGRGCSASISYTPAALPTRSHHHTKPYRCRRNIHHNLSRRCSQAQRCFSSTTQPSPPAFIIISSFRSFLPQPPPHALLSRQQDLSPLARPENPDTTLPPRSTPLSTAIHSRR